MKIKFFIMMVLLVMFNLTAEESELSKEELLEKIEAVEAELEMIKIESSDNNPMQTGETLDWGKGFSVGLQLEAPSTVGIDFMYNLPLGNNDGGYKITPKKDMGLIWGFGIQARMISYDDVYWDRDNFSNNQISVGYTIGPKVTVNSPVLLNYISFSSHFSPFISIAKQGDEDGFNEVDFGFEVGSNINFWYNENANFFIGWNMKPSLVKISGDGNLANPLSYNITCGVNVYF